MPTRKQHRFPKTTINWVAISAEVFRTLAPRWTQFDKEDIESAVNFACAKVHERLTEGKPIDEIIGYVWTIAHRLLLAEHEKHVEHRVTDHDFETSEAANGERLPHRCRDLDNKATAMTIVEAINKLPDSYRVSVQMHTVEGKAYKEVARAAQTTEGVARANVHRGKSMVVTEMALKDNQG